MHNWLQAYSYRYRLSINNTRRSKQMRISGRGRGNATIIMLNVLPMMMQSWKPKPEAEFQHGDRLFPEIGSSNISRVDWDILPKSALPVDFDPPNWEKPRKAKPEVELWRRGRHLENRYDVITLLGLVQIGRHLVVRGWTAHWTCLNRLQTCPKTMILLRGTVTCWRCAAPKYATDWQRRVSIVWVLSLH